MYLQNTHDVTIDHASANADDTGAYVLDNAWNVNLGNSTAEAGGPICITLDGQKTFTGYLTDLQVGLLLVNGSHDNTIQDDQFAGNAGLSIGSGGNGFFGNPCTNTYEPFSPAEAPMGVGNTFTASATRQPTLRVWKPFSRASSREPPARPVLPHIAAR